MPLYEMLQKRAAMARKVELAATAQMADIHLRNLLFLRHHGVIFLPVCRIMRTNSGAQTFLGENHFSALREYFLYTDEA